MAARKDRSQKASQTIEATGQYVPPPVAEAFRQLLASFQADGWAGWTDEFWEALPTSLKDVNHTLRLIHDGSLTGRLLLGGNGCPADTSGVAKHVMRYEEQDRIYFLPTKNQLANRLHDVCTRMQRPLSRAIQDCCKRGAVKKTGKKELHIRRAFMLPLVIYSQDTAYMCELFRRMKSLGTLRRPTKKSVHKRLGPYAGIAAGIAESCRVLRKAIVAQGKPEDCMQRFFSASRRMSIPEYSLAVRGLWVPADFNEAALPRVLQHYNFASFSLSVDGALSVLEVYKACVPRKNTCPLLLLARREKVLSIGFPTQEFHLESVSLIEEELILPPFAHFEPVGTVPLLVPLRRANSAAVVEALAAAWKVPIDRLHLELKDLMTTVSAGGYPRCLVCGASLRPISNKCTRRCCTKSLKCVHCTKEYCPLDKKLNNDDDGRIDLRTNAEHCKLVFLKEIHAEWP